MQQKKIPFGNLYHLYLMLRDGLLGINTQRLVEFINLEIMTKTKIKTCRSDLLIDIDIVFGRDLESSRSKFCTDSGVGEDHG
jgi:hypothetical protein